ncbi:hypothetical protein C6Y14_01530 [Streptomyces dioscori]|uniref:Secreted protein n=2 Tax=Streptomyces dioscori TaxID=2109333 RepID=A0A2P8QEZ4_9ACTN|nr:hypothetical protein C6Y14_01530 [Streptomyces dioscori]
MLARASLTMLCVTGAVFATVPTAQAAAPTVAPVADCRLLFGHDSSGQTGRFCKDGRSQSSDDRERGEEVGGLVGLVLDVLFD